MKTLFKKIISPLKSVTPAEIKGHDELDDNLKKGLVKKIEESFMAIAYAEAARFEDVWNVLKMEEKITLAREKVDFTHPEECQYDDNELCYHES